MWLLEGGEVVTSYINHCKLGQGSGHYFSRVCKLVCRITIVSASHSLSSEIEGEGDSVSLYGLQITPKVPLVACYPRVRVMVRVKVKVLVRVGVRVLVRVIWAGLEM